jgi:hypothetical protein
MNRKFLILLVSVTATVGLSGCAAINCPAEFARPKSKELFCGVAGNVMSTGSEVYITPAQYQEWRRQNTPMYGAPPTMGGVMPQPAPLMAPAPLAPSTSQRPVNRAVEPSDDPIEG